MSLLTLFGMSGKLLIVVTLRPVINYILPWWQQTKYRLDGIFELSGSTVVFSEVVFSLEEVHRP